MSRRTALWISFFALLLRTSVIGQQFQPSLDRSEQLFLEGRFEEALALKESTRRNGN
jgi:hypothetical protein